MSDEMQMYEVRAEITEEEVALFEEKADALVSQVEEIAAEAREMMVAASSGYKIVDLRGKFCSRNGNWGVTTKNLGAIGHYNGPAVPERAWTDPIAWIKFINDLHNDPGRFSPGWTFDGIAYHEFISGDTVYLLRDFGAKLPHCGNLTYNGGALGIHIPVGTGQQPSDLTYRTFFTRVSEHLKVMKLSRAGLRGHKEVGSSECPGTLIQSAIGKYRAGQNPGGTVSPSPSEPTPAPKDTLTRLYLAENYGKNRQVGAFSTESGVKSMEDALKSAGLKTYRGKA